MIYIAFKVYTLKYNFRSIRRILNILDLEAYITENKS